MTLLKENFEIFVSTSKTNGPKLRKKSIFFTNTPNEKEEHKIVPSNKVTNLNVYYYIDVFSLASICTTV